MFKLKNIFKQMKIPIQSKPKRLAIIGGGISGMLSARYALENQYEIIVFEKNSEIGGVWSDKGYAWPEMNVNVSKYSLQLSDFLWRDIDPLFPSKTQMHSYFKNFVETFGILPYFRFNTCVTSVKIEENQSLTVNFNDLSTNESHSLQFDHILVCSGRFAKPDFLNIDSLIKFSNIKLIHAGQYRSSEEFMGNNVMVIGHGHSATQISAEISKSAKSVINLFRKPHWIFQKCPYSNVYGDYLPRNLSLISSREIRDSIKNMSKNQRNQLRNEIFSTLSDQMKISETFILDKNSTNIPSFGISDYYLNCVKKGLVKPIKGSIEEVKNGNNVVISNGESYEIDVIVVCGGYFVDYSFLDKKILEKLDYNPLNKVNPIKLSKSSVYNKELKNVAFVGFMPYDILLPSYEFQVKVALQYFSHQDNYNEFLDRIELHPKEDYEYNDIASYCEMLADELDCRPDLEFIKKVDPLLYEYVWKGPWLCQHFLLKEKNFGSKIWEFNANFIKKINKEIKRKFIVSFKEIEVNGVLEDKIIQEN